MAKEIFLGRRQVFFLKRLVRSLKIRQVTLSSKKGRKVTIPMSPAKANGRQKRDKKVIRDFDTVDVLKTDGITAVSMAVEVADVMSGKRKGIK